MSSTPVLCSVAIEAFGTPPRRSHIEARKLPQGFEVWFFDEHSCPDGQPLAQTEAPYTARAFAEVMLRCKIDRRLWSKPANVPPRTSWSAATVTGERGLWAHLLRLVYTTEPDHFDWLLGQSDASFEFLETLLSDPPDIDWDRPFLTSQIMPSAYLLGYDTDYLDLLRRYGLPAEATALPDLAAALCAHAERRQQKRTEAEREALIAPFRREIEAMTAFSSDNSLQGGGIYWGNTSSRSLMRGYLEQYVVEHGEMPKGTIDVVYKQGSMTCHFGPINFDRRR